MSENLTTKLLDQLWNYCVESDWAGWDPYDGLAGDSSLVRLMSTTRIGRLALIQSLRRLPINARPLLGVPKLVNPKALALGLIALRYLRSNQAWDERASEGEPSIFSRLAASASRTPHGTGWGYPFDWQARAFFIPAGEPTVVCTGFVVRSLAEYGCVPAEPGDQLILKAARFVAEDLPRHEDRSGVCFSYSMKDKSQVINASLLGAEILAHGWLRTRNATWLELIENSVRWALERQSPEGGWCYGRAQHHSWEDSFHTGFNLASLTRIKKLVGAENPWLDNALSDGWAENSYRYFAYAFIRADGRVWYFRHTPWPGDAHAAAVAIMTLCEGAQWDKSLLSLAESVAGWAHRELWLPSGYFIYRRNRLVRNSIPYLRWSQAWMLAALSQLQATRDLSVEDNG